MRRFTWETGFLSLAISVFLCACSPTSISDYREQGKTITRSLIDELQEVHSHEELMERSSALKKLFNQLVSVLIETKTFQKEHPHVLSLEDSKKENRLSDQLRQELNRIYEIDGARKIIEDAQSQALERLDRFERNVAGM